MLDVLELRTLGLLEDVLELLVLPLDDLDS